MPALFITAIIFAGIAVAFLIAAAVIRFSSLRSEFSPVGAMVAFGTFLVLALGFTVWSSANTVPVRNVGIVTSFNKPTGEVTGSGLHWVKPWEKVRDWDASRQYYDHIGDDKRIRVRTATLADAWVHLLVEYQTSAEAAPGQFQDYKQDFQLFKNKIGVQLDDVVNDVFADYNPLENIDSKTGNLNVPLEKFADEIMKLARERLGSEVDIVSISLPRVDHDEKTENNIKNFQDKLAEARNLAQEAKNAETRKAITEKNAEVDDIARCLEIAEKAGKEPGWCLNPGLAISK